MNENEDKIYLSLMAQRRAWKDEAQYWRERHDALLRLLHERIPGVTPPQAPPPPEHKD